MMKLSLLTFAVAASLTPLHAAEKPSEILAAISTAPAPSQLVETTQAQLYPASAYFPFTPELLFEITDVERFQQTFGATRYGKHLGVDALPAAGIKQISLGMSKGTLGGMMQLITSIPLAMNTMLAHGASEQDGPLIMGGIAAFEKLAQQSLQQMQSVPLGTTMLAVQFDAGKMPPLAQIYQTMGLGEPDRQQDGLDVWTLSKQADGRSMMMISGLIGARELYLAVGVKDADTLVMMITEDADELKKLAATTSYDLAQPKLAHNRPIQVRQGHFMDLIVGGEAVEAIVNQPILPELARLLAAEWRQRAAAAGKDKETLDIAATFVDKLGQTLKAAELRTTGFYSAQGCFDGHLNFQTYTNSENYLLAPAPPVLDALIDAPDTYCALEVSAIKPQLKPLLTQSELKQGLLAITQLLPDPPPSTELGRAIDAGITLSQQLTPAWSLYTTKTQSEPAYCLPIKDKAVVTSSLNQLLQGMSVLYNDEMPALLSPPTSLGTPDRTQAGVDCYTLREEKVALTQRALLIGDKDASPIKKLAAAALQPQSPRAAVSFVLRCENAPGAEDEGLEGVYIRVVPNGHYTQAGYIQLRLKKDQ